MTTPIAQDAGLQGRGVSSQIQNDSGSGIQQRISVSLSSDTSLHQRLTADLSRSNLSFTSQAKLNQQPIGPQTKVITSQPLAQHMAMKSGL